MRGLALSNARFRFSVAGATLDRFLPLGQNSRSMPCSFPARLLPYPLSNVGLPGGCIRIYPFRITFPLLYFPHVSLVPWLLSLVCPLLGIPRRSTGRWYAGWVFLFRMAYRQFTPVTGLPAAFPLCSRSPSVNGTSHGGSSNDTANTFSHN